MADCTCVAPLLNYLKGRLPAAEGTSGGSEGTSTQEHIAEQCELPLRGLARMKLSRDYLDFIDKMDTHHPQFGVQYRFDFDYEREKDDGKGL